MNEVVDKYGVIWVSAAGNQGPALSTLNTPPNISTTNIIGNINYLINIIEVVTSFNIKPKDGKNPMNLDKFSFLKKPVHQKSYFSAAPIWKTKT